MRHTPLPLFDLSEPRASGHPAPAQVASAAVPPAPASAPAPGSDPGPWPGLCVTYTRAAALAFFTRHGDATGRALASRGLGFSALATMEPRALLALDREVLCAVAPGACVVVEGAPRAARPRAVTSLAGIGR